MLCTTIVDIKGEKGETSLEKSSYANVIYHLILLQKYGMDF